MTAAVTETVVALPHDALPAADWADGYAVTFPSRFATARAATEAAFASFPAWVGGLMFLRNLIMTPFGLRTGARRMPKTDRIGFFPVVSDRPERIVVGFNDRHLDFRCVVSLDDDCAGEQRVEIATVIDRHNWLGRCYLATILPFHRLIIRSTLSRLARPQ